MMCRMCYCGALARALGGEFGAQTLSIENVAHLGEVVFAAEERTEFLIEIESPDSQSAAGLGHPAADDEAPRASF